jgi:hypothetical protein
MKRPSIASGKTIWNNFLGAEVITAPHRGDKGSSLQRCQEPPENQTGRQQHVTVRRPHFLQTDLEAISPPLQNPPQNAFIERE